ncbi:MAG: hypothetical protein A2136_02875 [Chloroflexi bacterium RBG_16_54_11]|nr:MAG: hypothetical protein A2136_02875 [Chloroflexi bacterium RBG_16_54_11]
MNEPGGGGSAIKLIGIGQSLRGDDGAGSAAIRLWQERYGKASDRPGLEVALAEAPGIGLLDMLEGARFAILVDAVRSDARPGTIHLLSADQLAAFTSGSGSAHGWGVAETLALGKQLMPGEMPGKLYLIGIEAGDVSLGESLSPEVELALAEAACLIEQLISKD